MTGLRYGSLFSGVDGLGLAVEQVFGASVAWHCELDPNASKVLAHHWPGTPNLGDITAVDWAAVEPVDVICGGSPCQDLSSAGKRAGMTPGTRSGLWAAMCRAIEIIRPSFVIWENVNGALSACAHSDLAPCPRCVGDLNARHAPVLRAVGRVLGDLATLGFDAEWSTVRASDVGAPHQRTRVFVVASTPDAGRLIGQAFGHSEDGGPDRVGPAGVVARPGGTSAGLTLLPTPAASNPNDGEDLDAWAARREAVKATAQNGNGFGTPLAVAVRLVRSGTELFGPYAPAVARWEAVTGHPVPNPLDDKGRLHDRFAEWMMGFHPGWICDHLDRAPALRAIGNSVVQQQAAHAIRGLLDRSLALGAA